MQENASITAAGFKKCQNDNGFGSEVGESGGPIVCGHWLCQNEPQRGEGCPTLATSRSGLADAVRASTDAAQLRHIEIAVG